MGMAASQARLLSLQARQSNLEYQGQQINQERTILSQQCTALYNSLLAMTVPTPPSTSDYTSIEYSGADGASSFSLGNIVPTGDTYTVELKYQKTGHYIEEKGSAAVTHVPQYLIMTPVEVPQAKTSNYIAKPDSTIGATTVEDGADVMCKVNGTYELQADEKFYELKNGKFIELADKNSATNQSNLYVKRKAVNATEGNDGAEGTPANFTSSDYLLTGAKTGTLTSGGLSASELSDYYICEGNTITEITPEILNDTTKFNKLDDGTYVPVGELDIRKNTGTANSADETNAMLNPDYGNVDYYVAGQPCMRLDKARNAKLVSDASFESYITAIRSAYPEFADSDASEILDNFQVYFTTGDSGLQVPHFVSTNELNSGINNGTGSKFVTSYDYTASGTYTSSTKESQCQLTFDTSGRIIEIKIPTGREGDQVLGYKTIELTASTVTDNAAYQDAYNKYEYAQYEYDKKQQEINAKTEILQQQDRNLELKLQRLDNERTQITTEIEAVEKVINENIEDSYKTFSG